MGVEGVFFSSKPNPELIYGIMPLRLRFPLAVILHLDYYFFYLFIAPNYWITPVTFVSIHSLIGCFPVAERWMDPFM